MKLRRRAKPAQRPVDLPSRGHTLLQEAVLARQAGDFYLAAVLCDKSISSFRALLKVRPLSLRARDGLRKAWRFPLTLFPDQSEFSIPDVSHYDWMPESDGTTARGRVSSYFASALDLLFDSEWHRQCDGKYGGPKPSHLSWKQFYLQNETLIKRYPDLHTQLKWAIEQGHASYVVFLLKKLPFGCSLNFEKLSIETAIMNRDSAMIRLLLTHGLAPTLVVKQQWSLIHYAVYSGDIPIVTQLIAHGGSFEVKDSSGLTPLFLAVIKQDPPMLEIILAQGVGAHDQLPNGLTPLTWAIRVNHGAMISLLLRHNTSLAYKHPAGLSLLHVAVFFTTIHNAGALVSVMQPDVLDQFGRTPLHWAVALGKRDWVDLLLQHGASPAIADRYGDTPLTIAQDYRHQRLTKRLKRALKRVVF